MDATNEKEELEVPGKAKAGFNFKQGAQCKTLYKGNIREKTSRKQRPQLALQVFGGRAFQEEGPVRTKALGHSVFGMCD